MREITYAQAVNEALTACLARDPAVLVIGEGVPDIKGIFGTTAGLQQKFGNQRIFDMPVSENGMTGICIGAAISGFKPVMVHQRIDFTLLAFDQIVNNAAKWFYMFGGKTSVPIVIRMLIGRGWGQGAQHSQSLQALYAHIPGLKVVMPTTPADAKGMLIAAVVDPNPVIFIEHRWLHNVTGNVPEKYYRENLTQARILKTGRDITLVASSYMTLECLKSAALLMKIGISAEVIDLRSLKPLDTKTISTSVKKTGRLLVVDSGYASYGVASEIVASVSRELFNTWRSPPHTITLPNLPTPTSWTAAEQYYPTSREIVKTAGQMLNKPTKVINTLIKESVSKHRSDVPDPTFTGPF
jgi:pyruvate dehydrogenase E1 component beta subunit